jgi:hypothetical protein
MAFMVIPPVDNQVPGLLDLTDINLERMAGRSLQGLNDTKGILLMLGLTS